MSDAGISSRARGGGGGREVQWEGEGPRVLTHPLLAEQQRVGGFDGRRSSAMDLIGESRSNAAPWREAPFEEMNARGRTDRDGDGEGDGFFASLSAMVLGRRRGPRNASSAPQMKIEPKTYFANERTFLSWLHTAVLIGTIGAGLASVHLGRSRSGSSVGPGGSEDSNAHVLTIVHKHEYAVSFPQGVGGEFVPAASYRQEGTVGGEGLANGDKGVSTMAVNEVVSQAISNYFQKLDGGVSHSVHAEPATGAALAASNSTSSSDAEPTSMIPLTVSMIMLCASVLLCLYATWTFVWRGRMIAKRSTVPFHDPIGPVVMGSIMIGAMSVLVILTAVKAGQGGD